MAGQQQDITRWEQCPASARRALRIARNSFNAIRGCFSAYIDTQLSIKQDRFLYVFAVLSLSDVLDVVPQGLPLRFERWVFRVLGTWRTAPDPGRGWDDPPPPSAERPREERYDPPNAWAADWTRPGMPGVLGKWCKRPPTDSKSQVHTCSRQLGLHVHVERRPPCLVSEPMNGTHMRADLVFPFRNCLLPPVL